MEVINILQKFSTFEERWSPRIIAELNGQHVLLAKIEGEFVWHQHHNEDELFYVVRGELTMEFRDKTVGVKAGEVIVVPKGVAHRPIAQKETWIVLFEPIETKHTGDVVAEVTKKYYPKI